MSSLLGLSRFFLIFPIIIVLFIVCGIVDGGSSGQEYSIHIVDHGVMVNYSLSRYMELYHRLCNCSDYIVYRGMEVSIHGFLVAEVVPWNESINPSVNVSLAIPFEVLYRVLNVSVDGAVVNCTYSVLARVPSSIAPGVYDVSLTWFIEYGNYSEAVTDYLVFHVVLTNVSFSSSWYNLTDDGYALFSFVYPSYQGIGVSLFNPGLGWPIPSLNDTNYTIPFSPGQLIIYNVNVSVKAYCGGELLANETWFLGELYANDSYVFRATFMGEPCSPWVNVSLYINFTDEVHGLVSLVRNYTVYSPFIRVTIVDAPSGYVLVYDGFTGRLVANVSGPWPKAIWLTPYRQYVFKCPGCSSISIWLTEPTSIVINEAQPHSYTPGAPPKAPEPPDPSILLYIAVLAAILFTITLLLESIVHRAT